MCRVGLRQAIRSIHVWSQMAVHWLPTAPSSLTSQADHDSLRRALDCEGRTERSVEGSKPAIYSGACGNAFEPSPQLWKIRPIE